MDLALHMGMTAEHMTQSMTEAEFNRWARYAYTHALPYKRIEMLLAQVSLLIARTMGGSKDAKLNDFMLQVRREEAPEVRPDARKVFNFQPRKRRAA